MAADWFTDPGILRCVTLSSFFSPPHPLLLRQTGPYSETWEGYNREQFVGLVYFTFRAPLAFTLLYTVAQQALTLLHPRSKTRLLVLVLSVTFFLSSTSIKKTEKKRNKKEKWKKFWRENTVIVLYRVLYLTS